MDKLLFGHLQAGQPGVQHRATRLAAGQPVAGALRASWGCRANPGDEQTRTGILGRWIGSDAFAAESVAATVNGLIDRQLRGYLPNPEGMTAEQWVPIFRQALLNRRSELLRACADAAYNMAFSWHREFAGRRRTDGGRGDRDDGPALRAGDGRSAAAAISTTCWPQAWRSSGTMGPPEIVAVPPQVDAALRSMRGGDVPTPIRSWQRRWTGSAQACGANCSRMLPRGSAM